MRETARVAVHDRPLRDDPSMLEALISLVGQCFKPGSLRTAQSVMPAAGVLLKRRWKNRWEMRPNTRRPASKRLPLNTRAQPSYYCLRAIL